MIAAPFADPWRFQPNVEVYLLVAFLIGAFVYTVRVLGPRAVPTDLRPISRRNLWCFAGAMLVLFLASTWPIHQIGEDYLYSVHMVQHMLLTYVLPPLVLLATPEWLMRVLIGGGRAYRVVAFLTRPVVAAGSRQEGDPAYRSPPRRFPKYPARSKRSAMSRRSWRGRHAT